MTCRRSESDTLDGISRDDDLRENGIQFGWLAFDRRSFAEILHDWQEQAACASPSNFIRSHLRLDGVLSLDDFNRLLTGEAAPSHELALWLAALVPPEVATSTVLRNRGYSASLKAGPGSVVGVSPDVLAKARCSHLRGIAAGKHGPGLSSSSSTVFFEAVMNLLCERAGRADLDPEATAANLAEYLGIPADALRGRAPLLKDRAGIAASELAALLGLEGEAFDSFTDRAARAFTDKVSAAGDNAMTRLAAAVRFLREQAGLTRQDLAKRMACHQNSVWAAERGYPAVAASKLASALGLDDESAAILSRMTAESMRGLTHPTEGRGPTPFEEIVSRFAADGLTTANYLKAALRRPQLFCQATATVAGNIEGVVERFAADGLTKNDYLKAALKQPTLFCQSPATVIVNIEGVVERFAADGLTIRDYLRASLRQPSLLSLSPTRVTGNIEGVVERFAADGLTTANYLKAGLKQPQLFSQSYATIAGNIEGVVERFAADGLTMADYLRAAVKQPPLFSLSPGRVITNIEGVVGRFAADGLTTRDYLRAALKYPTLFCQSPATIGRNIATVIGLYDRGVFAPPPGTAASGDGESVSPAPPHMAVLAFLLRNPSQMSLSEDNYALREIHQRITGAPPNGRVVTRKRPAVERDLMRRLGHRDPSLPVPTEAFIGETDRWATEERAQRFVLRAIMHAGLIRSGSMER